MDFSKNDLSKARAGDKIWDIFIQEFQTVRKVTPNSNWPIEFESGCICSFGGFSLNFNDFPRFYWSEPNIEIPPPPKRMVKKTIRVWVRMNDFAKNEIAEAEVTADEYTADTWRCKHNHRVEELTKEIEVEE